MSNDIMDLLELYDEDSDVLESTTEGNIKSVTISKIKREMYCPICGCRLHSKGTFTRHPNNQIFQGSYVLKVTLTGRRWECSNPDCDYKETDQFKFIQRYKHNTTFNDISIIWEMKDMNLSCRQIARRYNVSDTYVHTIFSRYVSLPRLPLTSIISIDEVYLNISPRFKYALIIMDWVTGDIIDILPSRRKEITGNYFRNIPKKERDQVLFLICDMYDPYVNYTKNYFRNAKPITDSFHVVKWILHLIQIYINQVKKRYQERDRKALEKKNHDNNSSIEKTKDSREVYILKNANWVLLKNEKNFIDYKGRKWNHFLNQYMDRYDWEREFIALDPNFNKIKLYLKCKSFFTNLCKIISPVFDTCI
jgi:transposase